MKKNAVLLCILLLSAVPAFAGDGGKGPAAPAMKVRITAGDRDAVVALYDTPVSRDFASLLPLTVTFADFAGTEKIASLPRKLHTQRGLSDSEAEGDFAYYAPWGNLAVFYKGFGTAGDLYIMGRIESGKEWLGSLEENSRATIEIAE